MTSTGLFVAIPTPSRACEPESMLFVRMLWLFTESSRNGHRNIFGGRSCDDTYHDGGEEGKMILQAHIRVGIHSMKCMK